MDMDKEKIAPHVDDIVRALGEKIERKKIETELENYVNTYRVGLDVAKRSIVKKYGGKISALSVGTNKTLAELVPNDQSVEILCRIITVNPKEIDVQGVTKQIYYGLVTDGTDTLPYTAWEPEEFTAAKGDVIRAMNAYTSAREWNGKPQLNFGIRTRISKEPRDKLPESSSPVFERIPPKKTEVTDLQAGLRNISLTARILFVEKREITVNTQPRTVYSGILGDATGKAQFSAWDDFSIKEDDCVSIAGGYVSAWRGLPQFNFDSNSRVEKIKDDAVPKRDQILASPPIPISTIASRGGALSTAIVGIIADIRQGSGLIFRCPQCRRATDKGECKVHGKVDTIPDLRTKAVIDDGTGTVTVILNRELTEKVIEKNLDECIRNVKDSLNPEKIQDDLVAKLIASPMQARGNVTIDDFGLTMIASSVEPVKVDFKAEAQKLLDGME